MYPPSYVFLHFLSSHSFIPELCCYTGTDSLFLLSPKENAENATPKVCTNSRWRQTAARQDAERPAGKCFKVRTHACKEVAHLSCEQGPPPLYCKAQVQHTSSFGSLVEQNECKINTAGIRTASDLYTKILTDPKRFEVAFLFIKKNVKRSWWTTPKVIDEHAHLCLPHILGKPWCCHMWVQSACSALYILGRANKVNGQTFKTLAAPKRSRVLS